MSDQNKDQSTPVKPETSEGYEAPKVETVVTSKDLEREVQYAGSLSQIG